MKISIFDLDGTLLDSTHRYRTKNGKIDLQHWRDNSTPEKIMQDKAHEEMRNLYQERVNNPAYLVAIATARIVCNATIETIANKLGYMPDLIHGRKDENDTTGGAVFKIEAVAMLDEQAEYIEFFDDNKAYCEAFKKAHKGANVYYVPSEQGH